MRVSIKTVEAAYVRGRRAAVRQQDGSWWLGSVTEVTARMVTIDYDRGGSQRVPLGSARILSLRDDTPTVKRPLRLGEVRAYRRKSTPNRVPMTAVHVKLMREYGLPFLFDVARYGEDRDKLRYVLALWTKANRSFFAGGLKRPRFLLSEKRGIGDIAMNNYQLGSWGRTTRTFTVSRRIFTAGHEGLALDVVLHEMAHQAVTEIDKRPDQDNHGPLWQAWMKKLGIPPRDGQGYDLHDYLNSKERAALTRRQQREEEATPLPKKDRRYGQKARILTLEGKWVTGRLVGFFRGGRITTEIYGALATRRSKGTWAVPVNQLYVSDATTPLPTDQRLEQEYQKLTNQKQGVVQEWRALA